MLYRVHTVRVPAAGAIVRATQGTRPNGSICLALKSSLEPSIVGTRYMIRTARYITASDQHDIGNIPALVRLIQAYLDKGINTILANNKLEPILGIFQQKLVNSRQNDHYGMLLLNSVIKQVPV